MEVHTIMTKTMQPFLLSPEIFYGPGVAILTWVDDFLIAGNKAMIKRKISAGFNRKDLGMPMY